MGNEVVVICGLIVIGLIICVLVLRQRKPSPIVKFDYDETAAPTLHEHRQREDDAMDDGMGYKYRHYRH